MDSPVYSQHELNTFLLTKRSKRLSPGEEAYPRIINLEFTQCDSHNRIHVSSNGSQTSNFIFNSSLSRPIYLHHYCHLLQIWIYVPCSWELTQNTCACSCELDLCNFWDAPLSGLSGSHGDGLTFYGYLPAVRRIYLSKKDTRSVYCTRERCLVRFSCR